MTTYEHLQMGYEFCVIMATYYLKKKKDKKLSDFYMNAATGYMLKQNNLTLAEAAY